MSSTPTPANIDTFCIEAESGNGTAPDRVPAQLTVMADSVASPALPAQSACASAPTAPIPTASAVLPIVRTATVVPEVQPTFQSAPPSVPAATPAVAPVVPMMPAYAPPATWPYPGTWPYGAVNPAAFYGPPQPPAVSAPAGPLFASSPSNVAIVEVESAEERAVRRYVSVHLKPHDLTSDQQSFIRKADANLVSGWQVIVPQYTIFATSLDDACYFARQVALQPEEVALFNHNIFVLHRMFGSDPAWVKNYADALTRLQEPLLPATPAGHFNDENIRKLEEAACSPIDVAQGGAASRLMPFAAARPTRPAPASSAHERKQQQQHQVISEGAPFLPVTSDENGTRFVDAEQISNHLDHNSRVLYDAINKINRTVTAMQRDLQETNGKRGGNGNRRNRNGNGRPGRRNDPR